MSQSTMQFITQRKLQELNRQRTRLREAYRATEETAAQAGSEIERLRRLYEGLRALKMAVKPLHPEATNLEILFYEAEVGVLSTEVLALWRERMEDELRTGQARAEFVYLFGALLEEWTRPSSPDARLAQERDQASRQLLEMALRPPEPNRHRPFLAAFFQRASDALEDTREELSEKVPEAPEDYDVVQALDRIINSIYHAPHLRHEARQFKKDDALRKELTDALTLLFEERAVWDWPSDGLRPRVLWTRNKWRLYLDEDLPTSCLLEYLGEVWQEPFYDAEDYDPFVDEPPVHKAVAQITSPLLTENADGEEMDDEDIDSALLEEENGSTPDKEEKIQYGSIHAMRKGHRIAWGHLTGDDDYGDYGGDSAVPVVQAEIQLAQAAFPDGSFTVVKLDLQDFYASIPHDLLLTMLEQYGIPEHERGFMARFLSPIIRVNQEETARMQRGLLTAHLLSDLMAHLLMCLLEHYIHLGVPSVQIVRRVDDICLLTSDARVALTAWRRIEAFCAACGLQINLEKTGAVCLGGTLPEGLPTSLPRWGMLELNPQGEWQIHQETFETHLRQSRERVLAAAPLLSRVQVYNANARYLLSSMGLGFSLGTTHRQAVMETVRRFHDAFFEPGRGILAGLREELHTRFLGDEAAAIDIPDAWVYWPVTAGGMGLQNPVVVAGQYHEAWRKWKPPLIPRERPEDWERKDNAWSSLYRAYLHPLKPVAPEQTQVMETLTKDFIARGADISEGRQKDLTPYWRWILTLYGPQILARFGTFRFLITELVPLQLISRQRLEDTSLDDTDSSSSSESL